MAVAALGAAWLGGAVFAAFWLAASIAVASEWIAMTRAAPRLQLSIAAGSSLAGAVFALVAGLSGAVAAAALAVGAVAATAIAREGGSRIAAWLAIAYATPVALVPILVRDDGGLGLAAILWMFAVVWTTDVSGYFVGRALGGPKLWPRVSPGKTWSGFAGGVAGAVVAGSAVALAAPRFGASPPLGPLGVALVSALASVASQGGDLAESALKRRCGVKDSGRLIPGHGGVMDRLDGFVAVAALVGLALAGSRFVRAVP